ncbi:uncharacterized protein LOC110105262 [Dendrobium catenatum]|uniref:uncharacterized protein LOC110105262 n=1 Tax=Dendrobium catenatum TaxID=906689 RepID=UPI00109F6517|nr:uncharacterized protein LOC110105262 [Dendrobium catenatum]
MVSLDKVCRPLSKGGLGVPSISALQHALYCSVIYKMYNSTTPLTKWLSTYYSSPWKPPHYKASLFWKSVCATAIKVKMNFSFVINPDAPIALHWDHWCNNLSFIELGGDITLDLFNSQFLSSLILGHNWNLPSSVPSNLADLICSNPITNVDGPCLIWNNCSKVYHKDFIEDFYKDLTDCNWFEFIWFKKKILKHSVYAWLALVGGLRTADALRLRNISISEDCLLCFHGQESVNHLFFECPLSFHILERFIPESRFFMLRPSLLHILQWVDDYPGSSVVKNYYKLVVCCIIYVIWKERNGRRYGCEIHSLSSMIINIKSILYARVSRWKNYEGLLGRINGLYSDVLLHF